MKKCIILLCCTLLFGIILILNTDGELPLRSLFSGAWKISKAVIKDRHLMLFDVKFTRNRVEFRCPKLSLRFTPRGIVCRLQQALLKYEHHTFSNINGIIRKHHKRYTAFLDLSNKSIHNVQIACDPFLLHPFQVLTYRIGNLKASSGQRFIHDLKVHVSERNIYHHIDYFRFDHTQGNEGYGCLQLNGARLKYLQKLKNVTHQNTCIAPFHCNGILNMRNEKVQQAFLETHIAHKYLGTATIALSIRDVFLENPIPAYFQLQSAELEAEGTFSNLKALEVDQGVAKFTSDHLLKNLEGLNDLSLQRPLYLKFHGNKQHLWGTIDTQNAALKAIPFRHIHSTFEIENLEKFSWNAHFYSKKMNPQISGFYHTRQALGEIRYSGHLAPEFTYIFNNYLPIWWKPFLEQFRFTQAYPYTHFNASWGTKNAYSLCFGDVLIENAHFKQSYFKHLHLNFGHLPGYCWLRINDLQIDQKHGACEIHWPYDTVNSQREQWIFNGNGHFKSHEWLHLLEDFIGKNKNFERLKAFDPNAETHVKFEGFIASTPNKKEHLKVNLKMPKGTLFDFPVRDLNAHYFWEPRSTHIKQLQAKLWDQSPITAHVSWYKDHFDFQLKGNHITTKPLLEHPFIKPWVDAIPKDNRNNYDGILDIELQGQWKPSTPLAVSGHGHLEFRNPNLSQIHLLGPLTRLFSKKLKQLPVVSFDQLISDFSFTEKQISTQKSTLLSPSTRADIRGHIDLPQQKIHGEIRFSFLDYQQLNFPVMKYFVQILQPISKGFSAKISGTFAAPRWTLSFNPFRFVLPPK